MSAADGIRKIKQDALLPNKRKKYFIRSFSKKKEAQMKQEKEMRGDEKTDLQKWYDKIMQEEMPVCWETGNTIDVRDTKGWHGSIAHVLPKEVFPSVMTHPKNYMILNMWGGAHGQYDSSWKNAMEMKVWPIAVEVIKILYPLLTPKEKKKLPDIVVKEIK